MNATRYLLLTLLVSPCLASVGTAQTLQVSICHFVRLDLESDATGLLRQTSASFDCLAEEYQVTTDAAGVTSPVYEGTTQSGENPLYEPSAGLFDPNGSGISEARVRVEKFNVREEFGQVQQQSRSMEVSITLLTNVGEYQTSPDGLGVFGALDPPLDYTAGPIRWMAPESIRLFLVDPDSGGLVGGDYLDIAAGSSFTARVVPEPASAVLLSLLACARLGRRR